LNAFFGFVIIFTNLKCFSVIFGFGRGLEKQEEIILPNGIRYILHNICFSK